MSNCKQKASKYILQIKFDAVSNMVLICIPAKAIERAAFEQSTGTFSVEGDVFDRFNNIKAYLLANSLQSSLRINVTNINIIILIFLHGFVASSWVVVSVNVAVHQTLVGLYDTKHRSGSSSPAPSSSRSQRGNECICHLKGTYGTSVEPVKQWLITVCVELCSLQWVKRKSLNYRALRFDKDQTLNFIVHTLKVCVHPVKKTKKPPKKQKTFIYG